MRDPGLDDSGLICAFWLAPVEPCGVEALNRGAATGRPMWLHLNLADARIRRWLEEEADLDPAVVEALLDPNARVHLAARGGGLVAVLGDLHHDFDRDPDGLGLIRIFVDARRMISVRQHRLRTADNVRRDLLSGGVDVASPAELFEHIVERLGGTFGAVASKLADAVDTAEDEILADRFRQQGKALGRVRRSIARLRRHMSANRAAFARLRGQVPPPLDAARSELRAAIEHMDTTAQDLELVQERTRLLQEEIAGRLGEATGRNLAILSTVTTALLPITLITGIFGMNVGGLPGMSSPHGFRWVMFVIMGATATALVLLLRRREK